ncbi:recombination regulator RecX [Pararhizobium antarcticum]|uniref:Regulatory protein RecX n=1 Tax=Pararhizobium antarcticum TaxID=1798805 RepID=A0A657LMG2_9HYPH|nr:recombination regulator RecX [Pararhizobium antarcticum]OJF92330.1 recombinase RecX [Pararhizobium antarcticum]OJF94789.1 recombinase RecX [Rhizobium sp. 58]
MFPDEDANTADPAIPSDVPTKRMLSWSRNSTLYRLGRRMMTERELFEAIVRKARTKFDDINDAQVQALAAAAVAFAYEIGGLNDTTYAQVRTRSGVRSGKSKKAIAQKLSVKGIARETAQAALEESNDLVAAAVFARKRGFGPFRRGELDEKRKIKELSAFARNGFAFDIGKTVFGMDREEAEEIILSGMAL